jgi:hypothetical protein
MSSARTSPVGHPSSKSDERSTTLAITLADATNPEELAASQGISPVIGFDELIGDFWPPSESADDFLSSLKMWRSETAGVH